MAAERALALVGGRHEQAAWRVAVRLALAQALGARDLPLAVRETLGAKARATIVA